MSPLKRMRELLTDRMEMLLLEIPKDQRAFQMKECERLCWEAGMEPGSPRQSPREFAQDLLLTNPETIALAEMAVEKGFNPEVAETPDDLILRLLPSDGHLE